MTLSPAAELACSALRTLMEAGVSWSAIEAAVAKVGAEQRARRTRARLSELDRRPAGIPRARPGPQWS